MRIENPTAVNPKRRVRVLHITQAVGGIKTYITGIIGASDKTEYEYGIACPASDLYDWAIEHKVRCFRVDFVRKPSLLGDTKSLVDLIQVIKSFKPHVLHAHSGKGGFIGRLAGWMTHTPTVFTPNAFSYLGFRGFQRVCYVILERIARRWAGVLLAVSESERNRAACELGYPTEKLRVVPNSIEIQDVDRTTRVDALKNHVGMVGRLLYQKNPEMFVRTARNVHMTFPAVRFSLMGEGFHDFSRDRVYEVIRELNAADYISIRKWGVQKDATEFLRSCDIYLSTSHFEGLPFTILEAMAYGVPVVATRVDGARDIITDGEDGFLVEDNDDLGMADRVRTLLEDPQLRYRISSKARMTIASRFNLTKNIRRIEDIYAGIRK